MNETVQYRQCGNIILASTYKTRVISITINSNKINIKYYIILNSHVVAVDNNTKYIIKIYFGLLNLLGIYLK